MKPAFYTLYSTGAINSTPLCLIWSRLIVIRNLTSLSSLKGKESLSVSILGINAHLSSSSQPNSLYNTYLLPYDNFFLIDIFIL